MRIEGGDSLANKRRRYRSKVANLQTASADKQQSAESSALSRQQANFLTVMGLLAQSNARMGFDGYGNSAAFLGDDSPIMAASNYQRSNLTQNLQTLTVMYRESWLAMRIIDMPCDDMTRAWYRLSTDMEDDDINIMRRAEAKHSIKQEIANAIRWARLYGGSIAVIALRGQEEILDQPLDMDSIAPGDFQGILVLDRTQSITPSLELVSNLDDPDFGLPMYYTVDLEMEGMHSVKIHHSRVLRFIGRELPHSEMVAQSFWGASELEHIYDELNKRNATSANIAQLVFQANITTLKMGDFGEALAMGTEEQKQNVMAAIMQENRFRTSFGLQLLSADDSMENHPYSFSGISDVYEQFMMDIAGAAEIPATKLFGRSPSGLNSTGEADLKNYYEMINQLQERYLRPALEKLVPVMALSCWGIVPDDLEIVFEPISAVSPTDRADVVTKLSDSIMKAFDFKLITRAEAIAELKSVGRDYGMWTKLDDPDSDDDVYHDDDDDDDPDDSDLIENELISVDADLSDDD